MYGIDTGKTMIAKYFDIRSLAEHPQCPWLNVKMVEDLREEICCYLANPGEAIETAVQRIGQTVTCKDRGDWMNTVTKRFQNRNSM